MPSPSNAEGADNGGSETAGTAQTPSSSSSLAAPAPPAAESPSPLLSARGHKLHTLEASNAELEQQLAALRTEHAAVVAGLALHCSNPDAQATVKRHIRLLHEYNEMRDVGLGLIGLVAEQRQVRVQDLMPEFGLKRDD